MTDYFLSISALERLCSTNKNWSLDERTKAQASLAPTFIGSKLPYLALASVSYLNKSFTKIVHRVFVFHLA